MLNRNAIIGSEAEENEGVEETLTEASYAGSRKDTNHSYEHEDYDRELDRGVLSTQPPIKSRFGITFSWMEECIGGGIVAGNLQVPPWHKTLQGLGFGAAGNIFLWTCVTTGATAQVGDRVGNNADAAAATKTAIVVRATSTTIWLAPTKGTLAATDDLRNYSRVGSYVLSGTGTVKGVRYKPETETEQSAPPSLTITRDLGGELHTGVGCRGTGSTVLRQGEPCMLEVEFQGVPKFDTGTRRPRVRSGARPNPAAIAAPPAPVAGIPLRMRHAGGEHSPLVTEMTININNTLARRRTMTDADIDDTGFLATRITDRSIQISIDPEHVAQGVFDVHGFVHGQSEFELIVPYGRAADPNGQIVFYAPRCSLVGSVEPGDRDGITTMPLTIGCYGDNDDELHVMLVYP